MTTRFFKEYSINLLIIVQSPGRMIEMIVDVRRLKKGFMRMMKIEFLHSIPIPDSQNTT